MAASRSGVGFPSLSGISRLMLLVSAPRAHGDLCLTFANDGIGLPLAGTRALQPQQTLATLAEVALISCNSGFFVLHACCGKT
jgi:hypothetical protein